MNYQIQLLRVIATLAVVLFHALGYYTYGWPFVGMKIPIYWDFDRVINQINMPLFVTISAYLYATLEQKGKYSDRRAFVLNKIQRILIPYLFWSVFQIMIFPSTTNMGMILRGCLHLWFLLMLFMFFLLSAYTKQIWKNNGGLLFTLYCVSVALKIAPPTITNYFNFLAINSVLSFLVYWIMGIWLSRRKINLSLLSTITLFVIGISLLITFTCWVIYPNCVSSLFRMIGSILVICSLFSGSLYKISRQITSCKMVQLINKNSYGIYILHHIIIWWIVQIGTVKIILDEHYVIMPILLFVTVTIISVTISEYIRKSLCIKWMLGERYQ